MTSTLRQGFALAVLLVASSVSADCLDPLKEPISRTETSVVVNSHPDGTALCVARPTRYCKECKPGYVHQCNDGKWYANRELACSEDKPISPPTETGGHVARQSDAPEHSIDRRHNDARISEAAIIFHAAIHACGGGAPLDAVHRSLANGNDPMWQGPPPVTAADILELTKAHYDRDQESLEGCRSGGFQDCTHIEERVDRSTCLFEEVAKRN